MEKVFMGKDYDEFFGMVKDVYVKEEGLNITFCDVKNETEYELDFFEEYGPGMSGVGSFIIDRRELHQRILEFNTAPMHFTKENMILAVNTAWNEKKSLLLYPEDMDLIVVDIPRDAHCYLTKTIIVDADRFDTKEELEEHIKNYLCF